MDGVLLVDKPSGPTSHDVVARLRSVTGEPSVGHTGTLDPLASGLLPLVFGRATRLSAHLTGGDKTYAAVIRLGFATGTDDAQGERLGAPAATGPMPTRAAIDAALADFRGTFAQMPPRHSAKKVGGKKSYDMARQDQPLALEPVSVTVRSLELTGFDGDQLRVTLSASAGFYVRAISGRPWAVARTLPNCGGPGRARSMSRTRCRWPRPNGWGRASGHICCRLPTRWRSCRR